MSLLSKVWFVTSSASGLRRSIAEVRLLNLMAIVMTFSIPVIYTFAADTPLLLETHNLIVDHSLPKREADTQIIAARRYDSFWNTGDETLARASLAPNFVDNTLPAGRPQGIAGPLAASRLMRLAIPDLRCEIEQMIVAGERIGRGSFHAVKELVIAREDYIENHNQKPQVFVWSAPVDRILSKIAKCKEALDAVH